MAKSGSIAKTGLLFACLLVGFQIILFGLLVLPQGAILKDADAAEQSTHVSNALSRLMANTEEIADEAYHGRQVARSAIEEATACRGELEQIKSSLSPEQRKLLAEAVETQGRILDITARSQDLINRAAFRGAARKEIKADVKQCGLSLMENTTRLVYLVQFEVEQINEAINRQQNNRQFARLVLILALIAEVCLSAVAFLWFKLDLGKRMSTMQRNIERLALDKQLLATVGGNDEISELDRDFHRMTDVLQAAARQRRALVEQSRDMICRLDNELVFSSVNAAARGVVGYRPEQLESTQLQDIVFAEDKSELAGYFKLSSSGKQQEPLEVRLIGANGAVVDTLLSAYWSHHQGSFFCIIHDNSKKKLTERLQREVLQMVNHDVKTPLFTVSSFLEMADEGFFGDLVPSGKKAVATARDGTGQMLALVDDILSLEKLRSGFHQPGKSDVNLKVLVTNCLYEIENEAEKKSFEIKNNISNMTVSVDAALIKQALVNLLTVLADLAASGSTLAAAASTRVGESQDSSSRSAKNTSRDGLVTELSITVEGSGPPQTTLPAMLDPYTAEYSTVSQPGRSRLSLAVSKAIVTVHGGDINAVNSNGRYGFVVILPAR